jgi:predicted GIY-YIG superfamily endonuclease
LERFATNTWFEDDRTFTRKIWSKILIKDNWRERLDSFSEAQLLQVIESVGVPNLYPSHLEYMTQRLCSAIINRNRRHYRKRTRQVFVIYWLHLVESPDVPIYVGLTQNLSQRWAAHRIGRRHTRGVDNIEDLRIKVVETICGNEIEATNAETRQIKAAMAINPNLLNKRQT